MKTEEQYLQQCTDWERSTAHVDGFIQYNLATPKNMTTWPRCTCAVSEYGAYGFTTYMGNEVPEFCEHIPQALDERCIWREDHGIRQTPDQRRNHVCPACGKSTINVKI